jgi:uncharacterized membrane protein
MKITDIPLDAQVECTDGPAGVSAGVIVDPKSVQVTHFVVREQGTDTQRLVSVEKVDQVSAAVVRLACTRDELAEMQPFLVTEYRQFEIPRYYGPEASARMYRAPTVETVTETREAVPWGEIALRPGTAVHASDGSVGQLSRLVTGESGQITYLGLEKGHLWGTREVLVPVSMVDHVVEGTIQLTIDKATLDAMLAIPVKQRYGVAEVELFMWTFDRTGEADQALETLAQLAKEESSAILSAAVLAKDAKGRDSIKEIGDWKAKHGALFGAITGGLIGLLGGPVGAIVGVAAGAATGGVAAKRIDLGLPDEFLDRAQARLQPGTAAVVVVAEREWTEHVAQAMAGFEGQLSRVALTDEVLVQFADEEDAS